jgi:hypothetical protein
MDDDFRPSQKYPSLTDDRLSAIANVLRVVRNTTLLLYDPLAGDGEWSLGCRVYERSCFQIRELSKAFPWLSIVAEGPKLRFTFAIGGVPVRFYRGSPDDPPDNYLTTTYGELRQRQMVFDIEGLRTLDSVLRLAVETDREGKVSTVKLVELDTTGTPTGIYLVPFDFAGDNVVPLETRPIDLPPIKLSPLTQAEQQPVNEEDQRQQKKKKIQ